MRVQHVILAVLTASILGLAGIAFTIDHGTKSYMVDRTVNME